MQFWFFWPWKRKEEKHVEPLVLPISEEERAKRLDVDLQKITDYFYNIHSTLIRAEHNAFASAQEIITITREKRAAEQILEKLRKDNPQVLGYWSNLINLFAECEIESRKVLPSSPYDMPLHGDRIEQINRITRNYSAEFITLLNQIKRELSKIYKKYEFTAKWPERRARTRY